MEELRTDQTSRITNLEMREGRSNPHRWGLSLNGSMHLSRQTPTRKPA